MGLLAGADWFCVDITLNYYQWALAYARRFIDHMEDVRSLVMGMKRKQIVQIQY